MTSRVVLHVDADAFFCQVSDMIMSLISVVLYF